MPAKPPQKTKACPTGGFSDVLEAFEGRTRKFGGKKWFIKGGAFWVFFSYSVYICMSYIYIHVFCIVIMTILCVHIYIYTVYMYTYIYIWLCWQAKISGFGRNPMEVLSNGPAPPTHTTQKAEPMQKQTWPQVPFVWEIRALKAIWKNTHLSNRFFR